MRAFFHFAHKQRRSMARSWSEMAAFSYRLVESSLVEILEWISWSNSKFSIGRWLKFEWEKFGIFQKLPFAGVYQILKQRQRWKFIDFGSLNDFKATRMANNREDGGLQMHRIYQILPDLTRFCSRQCATLCDIVVQMHRTPSWTLIVAGKMSSFPVERTSRGLRLHRLNGQIIDNYKSLLLIVY